MQIYRKGNENLMKIQWKFVVNKNNEVESNIHSEQNILQNFLSNIQNSTKIKQPALFNKKLNSNSEHNDFRGKTIFDKFIRFFSFSSIF